MASTFLPLFEVSFGPNPRVPDMHSCLNRIYRDYLPNSGRLLTDPTDFTTVLETSALLTLLRTIIVNEMLLLISGKTNDGNPIHLVLKDAAIHVGCGQMPPKRVSKLSITKALEHTRTHSFDTIDIIIDTSMFYHTTSTMIYYHDWTKLTSDVNLSASATTLPGSGDTLLDSDRSKEKERDYDIMANAMARAFSQTRLSDIIPTSGNTPHTQGQTPPSRTPATLPSEYHPGHLPDDVRARYEAKLRGEPITTKDIQEVFKYGHRYYLDGNDHLIVADGTLFTRREFDEKTIFREFIPCVDDTYAGIRKWYQMFSVHLHNHGYYVHPLWCYRKDVSGLWGFTAGEGKDDDLPKRMEISLRQMSHTIFRLLSKSDMFPKGIALSAIVAACYGDGYHAIKSILLHVHPIFHDYPATLITTYPKQHNLTLLQYYQLFLDFLQL